MIACLIQNSETAKSIILSVIKTANLLQKQYAVFIPTNNISSEQFQEHKKNIQNFDKNISNDKIISIDIKQDIDSICNEFEISFLFIQLNNNQKNNIRINLQFCRNLRIPYLLYKDSFDIIDFQKILIPVCFLEEEVEKAPFASAFARFCNSTIIILKANDYGSKTNRNVDRIKEILSKFNIKPDIVTGKKDSFKINFESVAYAYETNINLILMTSSREYGLDDVIFGPPEYKIIKQSAIPVILLNPRADLYALCD